MKTTTFDYYTTKDGYVACVGQDSFSIHYPDQESDGYTGSPFDRQSAEDKGWKSVSYDELPKWAKDEIENV